MKATEYPARLDGYAAAMFDVARAEGDIDVFVDAFYAAAKTIAARAELRDALSDPQIPISRRQGTVTDLLGAQVDAAVVASINFVVAVGQAKHLDDLASRLAEIAAEDKGSVVAEVQSAVALDSDQATRLEEALSKATGRRVQVKVVTDPSIMGGLVAKVGDTIFDGSVKGRLDDVREQWG